MCAELCQIPEEIKFEWHKNSKLATILPFLTRLLVMLQWSQRISDLNRLKFNTFPNSILHWKRK